MGVYIRHDSPFYWLLLERPGRPPLKESSKIRRDAPTPLLRRQAKQRADEAYHVRMTQLAEDRYALPVDRQTVTFDAYADWYDTHHIAKRRGAVRDRYALAQLRAFFGRYDLQTISRALAQEYATKRLTDRVPRTKRTVSPNTVNREMAVLKSMLSVAVPTYLKASPLAGMKQLRVVPSAKRVLSPEDETRLLAELRPLDRAFYIVAVDTLIRLSNVIGLKRSEFHGTYLALEDSKTGPYTVPLSIRAQAALASLPKTGEYFFPHRRVAKNERDWRNAVRLMLRRACERAGIRYGRGLGITFHTATRATGATRMLRAGVDPKTVQEVGHWRDLRSMQMYLHTDSDRMRDAVNRIGHAVDTPRNPDVTPDRKKTQKSLSVSTSFQGRAPRSRSANSQKTLRK